MLENTYYIQDQLKEKVVTAWENCLTRVLREFLQREPTLEDAKKCTLYSREGELDVKYLTYNGTRLGKIVTDIRPPIGSVTFYPETGC